MQKMFFMLCIAILAALYSCGDKDEDRTNNFDNKLIEGKWYGLVARDSMMYTFGNNKATRDYYAYIHDGSDGFLKYEGKDDYGNYLLTDTLILLSQPSEMKLVYRLSNNNDSLYIRNFIHDTNLWFGLKNIKE